MRLDNKNAQLDSNVKYTSVCQYASIYHLYAQNKNKEQYKEKKKKGMLLFLTVGPQTAPGR